MSKGGNRLWWQLDNQLWPRDLGAGRSTGPAAKHSRIIGSIGATTVADAGTDQPLAVTFTPTDSTNYTTAVSSQTITVNQAAQTVSVNPLGAHTYGDAPFAVSASSTNPALPLSYSASGACTNDGPTVTITSAGTCSVSVGQAGSND